MKRLACLLLMPAILLSQWAGLPHCHGDDEPPGHNLRPHFHTHHHEQPNPQTRAKAGPEGIARAMPEPLCDHDSSAIYLDTDAVSERSQPGNELGRAKASIGADLYTTTSWGRDPSVQDTFRSRPPPLLRVCARPLYVQHLALLL